MHGLTQLAPKTRGCQGQVSRTGASTAKNAPFASTHEINRIFHTFQGLILSERRMAKLPGLTFLRVAPILRCTLQNFGLAPIQKAEIDAVKKLGGAVTG